MHSKNTKNVSWRALHGSCLDVPDTIPWIELNNKKHLPRTHHNHHYKKLGKIKDDEKPFIDNLRILRYTNWTWRKKTRFKSMPCANL